MINEKELLQILLKSLADGPKEIHALGRYLHDRYLKAHDSTRASALGLMIFSIALDEKLIILEQKDKDVIVRLPTDEEKKQINYLKAYLKETQKQLKQLTDTEDSITKQLNDICDKRKF